MSAHLFGNMRRAKSRGGAARLAMLRAVVHTGAEPSAKGALLCAVHGTSSLSSAGPTMRACALRKSKAITNRVFFGFFTVVHFWFMSWPPF